MKIFTDKLEYRDEKEKPHSSFVMFLDKQETGTDADIFHCAMNAEALEGVTDPMKILEVLSPMLDTLVHEAFRDKDQKPITNWHATGFDPNFSNGVKV